MIFLLCTHDDIINCQLVILVANGMWQKSGNAGETSQNITKYVMMMNEHCIIEYE